MAERPETELKRVSARIEADTARRDELILQLKAEGRSLAQIAQASRLSRMGVSYVLKRPLPVEEEAQATS